MRLVILRNMKLIIPFEKCPSVNYRFSALSLQCYPLFSPKFQPYPVLIDPVLAILAVNDCACYNLTQLAPFKGNPIRTLTYTRLRSIGSLLRNDPINRSQFHFHTLDPTTRPCTHYHLTTTISSTYFIILLAFFVV